MIASESGLGARTTHLFPLHSTAAVIAAVTARKSCSETRSYSFPSALSKPMSFHDPIPPKTHAHWQALSSSSASATHRNTRLLVEERDGGLFLRPAVAMPARDLPKRQILAWIARDEADMKAVRKTAKKKRL